MPFGWGGTGQRQQVCLLAPVQLAGRAGPWSLGERRRESLLAESFADLLNGDFMEAHLGRDHRIGVALAWLPRRHRRVDRAYIRVQ